MYVFLIAPHRHVSRELAEEINAYVYTLELWGYTVYWPSRDTDQDDPVGLDICRQNLQAIKDADAVLISWDGKSQGCLFDLGMAFALGKRIVSVKHLFPERTPEKSFQNVVYALEEEDEGKIED